MNDGRTLAKSKRVFILIDADLNLTDEERADKAFMEKASLEIYKMLKRTVPKIDDSPAYLINIDFEMAGDSEGDYVWKDKPKEPKKSATTAALECCGQPMAAYSTSISHTAYSCNACGKAVQVKGGWGRELLEDGFENPFAMLPIIEENAKSPMRSPAEIRKALEGGRIAQMAQYSDCQQEVIYALEWVLKMR